MDVLYLSGSPRRGGNTERLLAMMQEALPGEMLRVMDYEIGPCRSCCACLDRGRCVIEDGFTREILPRMIECDVLIIGCPVYFNNVPSQTKALMDRTWAYRTELRNTIAGAVVVGRRYGGESAITALHSFYLKHEMIPANRGVYGLAYDAGEIEHDTEAIEAARHLAERIVELDRLLAGTD